MKKKKGLFIILGIIALIIVIVIVAIVVKKAAGKTFSCDELNITVSVDFKEDSNIKDYMIGLSTPSMVLVEEEKDEYVYIFPDDKDKASSLEQYIEETRKTKLDTLFDSVSDIKEGDGFDYFELCSKSAANAHTDEDTKSILAFYESDEKYWMVQIGGPEDSFDANKKHYLKWAKSVTFSE